MKLILFFNGWGMDERVVEDVDLPNDYVIEILNYPYTISTDLDRYEDIVLVGWSFGCYYLSKFVLSQKRKFKKVVAINGNGEVIGKNGINPKMFEYTLSTLTPENLLKFYKNMGIESEFKKPLKRFEEIKDELEYFKANYLPLENMFTEMIIGKDDRIIPSLKQKRYCEERGILYKELDMGHYPFDIIRSWGEIV